MKRYRPHPAGYIVLYVLAALCLADAAYTIFRQATGTTNEYMASFSFFSYLICALALVYVHMYARAQVAIDDKNIRVAFPANIRPKPGAQRAMFIYRQGELDMRFIDKTFALKDIVRYGYVEDLGYERLDQSAAKPGSKLFPVREVAFITADNKRYHMNAAIFTPAQRRAIFQQIRDASGVDPEGSLAEVLK